MLAVLFEGILIDGGDFESYPLEGRLLLGHFEFLLVGHLSYEHLLQFVIVIDQIKRAGGEVVKDGRLDLFHHHLEGVVLAKIFRVIFEEEGFLVMELRELVLGLKEVEKNVEKVVIKLGSDVLPSEEVSNGGGPVSLSHFK